MTREERKLLEEMRQLEEIEMMLEKVASLRAAAAAHRQGLQDAENKEARLRKKVKEWERSSGRMKE